MNRVGLKDYLLNHADDNDLLDCANAWDRANKCGQFDTYESVEEAAELNDWAVAHFFRLNGWHLESVSRARLLEDARDSIDDIIDWLGNASRYDLKGISSDIESMVDAKDPFEIINEVDCSSRNQGNDIEVNLSRGGKKATLSFSKLDGIDADMVDFATVTYATAKGYNAYANGASTEKVQAAFFKENGRRLSAARADKLTDACEKNMDALKRVLKDPEIMALDNLFNVELCSETYCATLANEAHECKYIASALEKMGFDVENDRAIEKHAELEPKQRTVFDRMIGRVGDSYLEVADQLDNFFDTDRTGQSASINDNWGNPILVKGGRDGYGEKPCVLSVYEGFIDAMDTSPSDAGGDNIFADCKIDGIWDENGSLFVTGALPDGHALTGALLGAHACAEMRQLTGKGGSLILNHLTVDGFHLPKDGIEAMGFVYREGDENALIHDLWDNPEMCSRPRFAEKALDMPAEEYLMYHDGVKTEFQITEMKEDSFAYDQGVRFDVKVLTNGHDCGNGRFCADLDEAHEFCQQFAGDIAGLGESLDDMCEDRREVACAVQDIDSGEHELKDRNHDNSEIGE